MSNLFLDDFRKPSDVTHALHNGQWQEFPSIWSWEIVRSYAAFTEFILKNGLPSVISFDHDLSMEHYPENFEAMMTTIDYTRYKEKTGLDCAKWLLDYCIRKKLELPDCYIHSFNPVGRINIHNYLSRFVQIRDSSKQNS
jgi:hypothetical protein